MDERLEFRRRLADLIGEGTMGAFASEVGIDQSTVSRWMSGSARPSRRVAVRIWRRYPELRGALMAVVVPEPTTAA